MVVMLIGILLFALNDVLGKWLVATYSVGQVLLIRSAAALLILWPFLWKGGIRPLLSLQRPGMQAMRVILSSAEVYCFYFAVITLPLADVMTYWLAAPIYVAALSPFLLGEQVGWRRYAACAVGFIGALFVIQPSFDELGWVAFLPLGVAFSGDLVISCARTRPLSRCLPRRQL